METAILGLLVGVLVAPVVLFVAGLVVMMPLALLRGVLDGMRSDGIRRRGDVIVALALLLWMLAVVVLLVGALAAACGWLLGAPTIESVAGSAVGWVVWPSILGLPIVPRLMRWRSVHGADAGQTVTEADAATRRS